MSHSLVCWHCGTSLATLTLPLTRFDTCKACGVALHACRQCEFYAVEVAKQCLEPVAEEERDKQRANGCDYFSPRQGAFDVKSGAVDTRVQLAALFGDTFFAPMTNRQQADDQIKQRAHAATEKKAALEALFKKKE